jgi:hypothetical protein
MKIALAKPSRAVLTIQGSEKFTGMPKLYPSTILRMAEFG